MFDSINDLYLICLKSCKDNIEDVILSDSSDDKHDQLLKEELSDNGFTNEEINEIINKDVLKSNSTLYKFICYYISKIHNIKSITDLSHVIQDYAFINLSEDDLFEIYSFRKEFIY